MISIRMLKCLRSEGYSYKLTVKFNQDILESYFSLIGFQTGLTGFYDHPIRKAVSYGMISLLLSRNASDIIKTGNCETQACDVLSVDIAPPNENEINVDLVYGL